VHHAVGVGEEDGVIAGAVVPILGGRVEDRDALAHDELEEAVDVGAAARLEREVA
jgi:hypothetical protein